MRQRFRVGGIVHCLQFKQHRFQLSTISASKTLLIGLSLEHTALYEWFVAFSSAIGR